MLEEDQTVQDYVLPNNCTVHAVFPGEIPIVVRHLKEKWSEVVSVRSTDAVAKVRDNCICVGHGQLFFGNRHLSDRSTINERRIMAASEVIVVDDGKVPVFITTRFKEECIGLKLFNTFQDLKDKVAAILDIPQKHQRLVFNQQVMIKM